jgi:HSP20 family protein
MTVVKFKNRSSADLNKYLHQTFVTKQPALQHAAPVNIFETENDYLLEIIAPGWNKEDFKIQLEENLVTVSTETKSERDDKTVKVLKSEYQFPLLKRSFTIDENVDADIISAEYVNGVLRLNFPKKPIVKSPTKQISIQ